MIQRVYLKSTQLQLDYEKYSIIGVDLFAASINITWLEYKSGYTREDHPL
jgi:hypothetical protein